MKQTPFVNILCKNHFLFTIYFERDRFVKWKKTFAALGAIKLDVDDDYDNECQAEHKIGVNICSSLWIDENP